MKPSYPDADWRPAHPNNYSAGLNAPDKVIVHVVQGTWGSALNWFENPNAGVSAHFTVATTGQIGQSLGDRAAGYHAGNWQVNKTSLGIEHAGYVDDPTWFTDEMYHASARLVAYKCKQYDIPINRIRILAHSQIQGTSHTDPGPYWNWPRYMKLIRAYRFPKDSGGEKPPPGTVWRVLVGSYREQSYASATADQLQAKGFDSYIYEVSGWHRVQAAYTDDPAGADALVHRLKVAGFKDAYALPEKA